MPSNLAVFLELTGNTKADCSVTPLSHVREYIYTPSALHVGRELGVPMCFKGPPRSHDCEGNNSGAGGLRADSEAAPSHAPM